ncbi:PREDICTED: uncharacterized protein LOC109159849 [Ipomoea nil]|uniref:uncharacterized protein LOC109159849 n=1 Tax=Ipomoea nil TaxID=35883 RepID=UPI0009018450|nr:PREDICTED: uncharacterized protein LOC109159849 [Ipomoea nil]
MKIISWNCRGIVNGRVRRHVKQLLNTSKADALCLLEIRSSKASNMIKLAHSLGYVNHFIVEPLGFAGGLLLFWKQGQIDLEIIRHTSQSIHVRVNRRPEDVYITFAYVRPNLMAKHSPWIVIGDFNDIASIGEQWGSNRVVQLRRLDRVLWNLNAQHSFPEGKIMVLPRLHSDHNPIMFVEQAGRPPDPSNRPIRFEAAWLTREDYKRIWKDAAALGDHNIEALISSVTKESLHWNKKVFGNIFNRKKRLEARIRGIQLANNYATSCVLQSLERELADELNMVLDQEEALWFQKSRMDWIRDGDRNTRFYHNSAMIRRNRNRIRFLKPQGEWTDDPNILSTHIIGYFSSLFCRVDLEGNTELVPVGQPHKISAVRANNLLRRASVEEVKKAAFGMKKFGSPGPDGIQAAFYQHFWEDVGPTLTHLVNQALNSSMVPKSLLQAFMTLIPKKDNPKSAADFRPITLLNVAFKVISKTIVNRMRPLMCDLIGPHQNSFLPGRSTQDNVILTQEMVHTMHKKRGRKGIMVIKIDLHKAYDSVDWGFLDNTLDGFGFPRKLINLIMFSLKESDISILWNGGRLPSFVLGRGLRQGDPLAPYLFNLVMERLAYEIQSLVAVGSWKPVHTSRGGIGISHLFFADDLMLFGESSDRQARTILNCLERFSKASGLKVNLAKSQIFCSPNTTAGVKNIIENRLGIPITENLGSYLGIPILQRRVSKDSFTSVVDKMRRKLATWKASSLSMAGRRVLVQSSLATIPTYTMQSMALPVSTCKQIDKVCRNFLWGHAENTKKIHTISWSEICKPRDLGGLGLRKVGDFNLAFLTKLAWVVLTNPHKLWVKVMREKYVKNRNFLDNNVYTNCSWNWSSILKGKNILTEGIAWKIGTGSSVNFWYDNWLGNKSLATSPNIVVPDGGGNMHVKDFIISNGGWNYAALESLLPGDMVDRIRAIPIPLTNGQQDKLNWPHSGTGLVTVSSAFSFLSGTDDSAASHEWIWKIKAIERVKLFVWKIVKNGLLVNTERKRRGLTIDSSCPRCGAEEETLDHLFRQCEDSRNCWSITSPLRNFNASNHLPIGCWIEQKCAGGVGYSPNLKWRSLFPYVLWNIWKARNNVTFNNQITPSPVIIKRACSEASEASQSLASRKGPLPASQIWVHWSPPQSGFIKLNSDGARKALSGLASAGGILRDQQGNWLAGFITKIGVTNSFIAELWGIREGLRLAKNRGYDKLIAETDSLSTTQVLHNSSGNTPEADTLIADCKTLMQSFLVFELKHVLREGNQCADYLANLGQGASWGTTILDQPPDDIKPLLVRDANSVTFSRFH